MPVPRLRSSAPAHRAPRRRYLGQTRLFSVAAAFLSVVALLAGGLVVGGVDGGQSHAAEIESELALTKTVTAPNTSPYAPGETFSYTIELRCNVVSADVCTDAQLTDALPAPLVFDDGVPDPVRVQGVSAPTVTLDGTSFTVDFTAKGESGTGILGGETYSIAVYVKVPANVSGDLDGTELVNVAHATASNAEAVESPASITLEVPVVLDSSVAKSVDNKQVAGATVPAVADQPVVYTVGGGNASNRAVDTLVIQDPADGSTSPLGGYLDFSGIGSITAPTGADRVKIEYRDALGDWVEAYATGPIPADTTGIPAIDPLTDVKGLRFTFSKNGGQLPPSPADGQAAIVINTVTNSTVSTIPQDQSVTIPNTAASHVTLGATATPPKTAPADVVVSNTGPQVGVTKVFTKDALLAGESTTALITATNGNRAVTELVIAEPSPGAADLAAQGLDFGGFTDDLEWPANADAASVEYDYADGTFETIAAAGVDTLPAAPAGKTVVGFTVRFTGPIQANATTDISFTVTAQPVPGADDVTNTNETTATVTDVHGKTGIDDAQDDLTRQPARVSTSVEKNIAREELWAAPGAVSSVSIVGAVNDAGSNASTVGSEHLTITDPADTATPSEFWNTFNLARVTAGVPSNANLTVKYWDGSDWQTFAGAGLIEGSANWDFTVPNALKDTIQGVQFVYTGKDGKLLPPGFTAAPYLSVQTRDEFRDGSGSVADAAKAADPLVVANRVSAAVSNPNDTTPADNKAEADDTISLKPLDGAGVGPDLIEKRWLSDEVYAFSDEQRTARLSWSTEGLPFTTVTVVDDPTPGAAFGNIQASVYDAFDLAKIEPITPALDPLIAYDKVERVELFNDASDTWDDITGQVCTPSAACDGAFPGYVLTAAERASTLAVRLTYAEGSKRTSEVAPPVDSGVAASYNHERGLDLTFQIRQKKRSGGPVVGDIHTDTYNTGVRGLVKNTVNLSGQGAHNVSQNADDTITIRDTPVNVEITKTFDQNELPVPPAGTDAGKYPLVTATIVATNTTQQGVKVDTLSVSDPAAAQAAPTAYNWLNLYAIGRITVPDAATTSTVTLTRVGGATTDYTIAQAQALTATALADVIGVSVAHSDPTRATIVSGASSTLELTFQMREFQRDSPGTAVAVGNQARNVAHTDASRPGGHTIDEAEGTSEATVGFVAATYGVLADKTLAPATRFEDQPRTGYQLTLTGQPTGNVRTTKLTISDTTPTFWNAFELASLPQVSLPTGVRQLRTSVLVGVEASLVGSVLTHTCESDTDLSACWVRGNWEDAATNGTITPKLPDGITAADVRGVRFEVRRDNASSNWERPRNPQVVIKVNATRLENLRVGPGGEVDSYLAPTTRIGVGLSAAPGETVQGTTSNVLDVHGDGSWGTPQAPATLWTGDAADSANTVLQHRVNRIKVEKAPGNGAGGAVSQQYPPDFSIPYAMTITNTGDWNITGLKLADQIAVDGGGALLVPMTGADPVFKFTLSNQATGALPNTGFSASLDESSGAVAITVPASFVFKPGDKIVIQAALMFRLGLVPSTPVENSITATSDRVFERCESTLNNRPRTDTTNVASCEALTTVNPAASAPIGVAKAVKGVAAGVPDAQPGDVNYDDLGVLSTSASGSAAACATPNAGGGYYTNSCVPITRPGGVESWRMTFTNRGNMASDSIVAIDVLPAVNDTGVVTAPKRGSAWSPTLLGNVASNAPGATVSSFYTNVTPARACNGKDIEYTARVGDIPTNDACYRDVSTRVWTPFDANTAESELAAAKAVKFVISFATGAGLAPGGAASLTFETRTPWVSDAAVASGLPIAWNTVAAGSRGTDAGVEIYQGPVEPVRAGVAAPTGVIALKKNIDTPAGWTAPLPSGYDVGLQCVSGVTPVTLVGAGGVNRSTATVAANGTVLYYGAGTNLPLFSTCTAGELPSQGATASYDPAGANGRSGSIEALRGFGDRADVHHPFEDAPEHNLIEVTNSYEYAGFSVTKTVDSGGALNQDGEGIVYSGPYNFRASCQFLGNTVLNETFSLGIDGVKEFTALPAGATCSVTETGRGGASSTSSVFTQAGSAPVAGTGPTSSFTLTADDAQGDFTSALVMKNVFTVGAATITKAFAGNGSTAWGNESFTVGLSCTLASANPQTVFDGTKVLTKTAPVWNVAGLPTGANCTVTEPDKGGANGTAFSPSSFTVGANASVPTAVTVTNTFTTGTVNVVKLLAGAPAASLAPAIDDEYTIELSCTRDVNGVSQPIAIPGGAERALTVADAVAYDGLPTGAECTVSETGLGHAQSSTISPNGGVVTVGDSNSPVEVEITNTFENGSLEITKTVSGAGSSFAPATFDATVSCSWQGAALTLPDGGAVTLEPGVPASIGDLPLGSVCSIDESDAGQTSWTATPASVTVSSTSDAAEIAVDNVYELAGLRVEKTVQTGSTVSSLPTRFGFSAQCTFEGTEVLPLTSFTLNAGQHRDFTGLPARSECTVTETDARGADSTVSSVTVVDATLPPVVDQATSTVEIPELTADASGELQNTVGFTNLFDSSALVVQKRLEGGAATVGTDKTFDIAVVCTLAGEDPVTTMLALNAGNGFSASLGELIVGTECSIVEQGLQGADSVVIEPNDGSDLTVGLVTIPNAGSTLVTVSNWYLSGSLAVTKAIVGDAAAAFGTGDFTLELSCTLNGQAIAVAGGSARTVSAAAPSALFTGLPTGAECALSETGNGGAGASRITDAVGTTLVGDAADGYTFTVATDASVLDAADQPQPELVVENTFNFAAVTATKTVESAILGADGEPFDHGEFELALSCTLDGNSVSAAEPRLQKLAAGESVSWTQLPEGADCEITETDTRGALGTTIVSEQGAAKTAVTGLSLALDPLLAVGGANTVSVVNEFAAASVTLRKVVDGTAADTVKRSFPVALSCVLVNEQYPAPGLIVRDAVHEIGGSKDLTVTDDTLPAGVECTVTETDTGNATKTTVTVGDEVTDGPTASFVIAAGAVGSATVTVTNTFTAPPADGLSSTGVQAAAIAGTALLIFGLGGVLLFVGRRRRVNGRATE
ncbi:DUF5979 domain-containing protein [Microterricola pindariensis]|uniref:DUF5979 domain-containing protein n=1 Tax=Microterricola pindariensis TaxID=478010 RepID=UPI001056FB86|nr:DUF5979 domain-containing protein [Microterricola pindariensis]